MARRKTTRLEDLPDVITVEQTADILGISRSMAYQAVRTGEIPALRIGRRVITPKRALVEYLETGVNPLADIQRRQNEDMGYSARGGHSQPILQRWGGARSRE